MYLTHVAVYVYSLALYLNLLFTYLWSVIIIKFQYYIEYFK
nr:MAG TPA: hypothetical protein [Caudoviricetes sp.]DAU84582.1 MAG TPA: hypothetical protein [Caudoviricetes sp.]